MRAPAGWVVARIGDVLLGVEAGKSEQTLERRPTGDDVGVVKVSSVTWGEFDSAEAKAVRPDRFDPSKSIRRGDLLFSRANTVELAGAVVQVNEDHPGLMLSDKILRLIVDEEISPRYLMFALRTVIARRHLEGRATGTSTSMRNITQETLRETPLLLPPSLEQRRIVAKLDAILKQTRAAKARLDRLPALLEKLKRSILAAAFRGDLTKDWRAANPDVEPASVLLDRIRAERRRRWEDGVRAKGRDPSKSTYEEPTPLAIDSLPTLPHGWEWASIEQLISERMCNGISIPGSDAPPGTRSLKLNALRDGGVDFTAVRFIDIDADTIDQLNLHRGDFLVSRGNGSLHLVGKGVAIDDVPPTPTVYPDTIIRLRLGAVLDGVGWVPAIWGSPDIRRQIEGKAKTTAGIFKISQGDLGSVRVPIPPVEEQRVLAQLVAKATSNLSALLASCGIAEARVDRLQQAVLAKAFRGELVPQDPSDEPAAVLLARVRAARETEPARTRRGRGPRTADAPPTTRPTNGHGAGVAHDDSLDLIVAAFQQGQPRLTATAITEVTGLDAAAVKNAIKALVDGGQVRIHGKARGTSYEWIA